VTKRKIEEMEARASQERKHDEASELQEWAGFLSNASQPSLDAIWDNRDDDVYSKLLKVPMSAEKDKDE
jgi:hypothetical protein